VHNRVYPTMSAEPAPLRIDPDDKWLVHTRMHTPMSIHIHTRMHMRMI
jgi:hypothetical protein